MLVARTGAQVPQVLHPALLLGAPAKPGTQASQLIQPDQLFGLLARISVRTECSSRCIQTVIWGSRAGIVFQAKIALEPVGAFGKS